MIAGQRTREQMRMAVRMFALYMLCRNENGGLYVIRVARAVPVASGGTAATGTPARPATFWFGLKIALLREPMLDLKPGPELGYSPKDQSPSCFSCVKRIERELAGVACRSYVNRLRG